MDAFSVELTLVLVLSLSHSTYVSLCVCVLCLWLEDMSSQLPAPATISAYRKIHGTLFWPEKKNNESRDSGNNIKLSEKNREDGMLTCDWLYQ